MPIIYFRTVAALRQCSADKLLCRRNKPQRSVVWPLHLNALAVRIETASTLSSVQIGWWK